MQSMQSKARVSITLEAKSRLKRQIWKLGLPHDFVDEIATHCMLLDYNKGSILFLRGSPADVFFYVLTGMVKVYCARPGASRIMVKLAGPGDLVGHADSVDSQGFRAQR